MKHFLNWLLINSLFSAVWIIGIFADIPGFITLGKIAVVIFTAIAIFLALIMLALTVLFNLAEKESEDLKTVCKGFHKKNQQLLWIDRLYDLLFILFLAYYGFGFYAGLWLLTWLCLEIYKEVSKQIAES